MEAVKRVLRLLLMPAVILLQVVMTQVTLLVLSLPFPGGMEGFLADHPLIFVLIVGITYSIGVFVSGWLAIERGWLRIPPMYMSRIFGTTIFAHMPMVIAWIILHKLEPGSPAFLVAILTAVLGFYLPGWLGRGT